MNKSSTERTKREIGAFLKELRGVYPTTIENKITHEEIAQNERRYYGFIFASAVNLQN